MKQVLQNLKDGSTEIAEVPCPRAGRGELLIRTTRTLDPAGTERMLVDFGKAGLIRTPIPKHGPFLLTRAAKQQPPIRRHATQ